MRDIRQTKKYADYLSRLGWTIERVGTNYAFMKKLPLVGNFIKIQRPEELGTKELKKLRILEKKYKVFQTIIEPANKNQESRIKNNEFKICKSSYLPSKTLHLDLTKSKEKLFNQIKKDARYCLRKTDKLKIYLIDKVDEFHASWKKAVGIKKHKPSKNELNAMRYSFGSDCLFLTTPDGSAGAIFLKTDKRIYYWQAFTSSKGRKELAQYKIVWATILWAKNEGVEIFDFEGIYDDRFPNRGWLGFSHFKKSFGGHEVEYLGAFSKFQFPF